jgi:DNA-directed RNA polymerase specialized sigma24 family protein
MTSEIENKKKIKEFFSKEYASMRSYIRSRISDATDRTADDILQDVALKMFSRTDYSSPINDVAAYVYHTIKNKIIDIFRSKKQLKVYESEQTMKFEAVVNDFCRNLLRKI